MCFQAPQANFWGFQSGQIIQNLKFSPAAQSSRTRLWIREFGFRFCPEEAKKHWRFEKGSLRTELWFDKHFRFWNQITGRFDLSHYNDRDVLSMTIGFMILWNRRHVQRRTTLFTSRSEQHSSSLICGDKITDTDQHY
jgi:hypothetical protein